MRQIRSSCIYDICDLKLIASVDYCNQCTNDGLCYINNSDNQIKCLWDIPKFLGKIREVGISQLFIFMGYPKCDKRWHPEVREKGYPKCDKGWITGKYREGATLCHNGFTNSNSPLWVNY